MKKVRDFSKSYTFLSVLYVALGIVLLAWPSLSVRLIGNGLGVVMIVLGVTYGIIYFTKDSQLEGFLQMDLVIGIVCLAFGLFIVLNPAFLTTVLPFAMGIILLLGAVVKIQSSINMKRLQFRKWYLVLICALIIVGLGVVVLCNPFETETQMLLYIGVCLILDGTTNLISLLCIQLRVKSLAKIQRENPDADIKDLLEKRREPAAVVMPADSEEPEEAEEESHAVRALRPRFPSKTGDRRNKGQE